MIEKNWQELQKPDKVIVSPSEYNPRQAVVSLGPLERVSEQLWGTRCAGSCCHHCRGCGHCYSGPGRGSRIFFSRRCA